MIYSVKCYVTKQWEDVHCRKISEKHYAVYLGKRLIGELFGKDPRFGWSVVSHAQPPRLRGLRLVRGFSLKFQAIDYLIEVGQERDTT